MGTTLALPYLTTRQAAQHLGRTISQLRGAIATNKIAAPGKTPSGELAWTEADLERARQALSVDLRRCRSARAEEVAT